MRRAARVRAVSVCARCVCTYASTRITLARAHARTYAHRKSLATLRQVPHARRQLSSGVLMHMDVGRFCVDTPCAYNILRVVADDGKHSAPQPASRARMCCKTRATTRESTKPEAPGRVSARTGTSKSRRKRAGPGPPASGVGPAPKGESSIAAGDKKHRPRHQAPSTPVHPDGKTKETNTRPKETCQHCGNGRRTIRGQ